MRRFLVITLIAILLGPAFSFNIPSPAFASHNANLFVSAENPMFQNYVAGPMVVEVVVIDNDIKAIDFGRGEPDVTVNGNKLRMVQAMDGNWYGYFADRSQAQRADAVQAAGGRSFNGTGLDFGTFCSPSSTLLGPSFTQTVGFAIARQPNNGGSQGETSIGGTITTTCSGPPSKTSPALQNNVVRENKTINRGFPGVPIGQIGIAYPNYWPVIQLYNFNPTGNIVIQYNKGGGVQSTTLKFDTVDQFAQLQLDRASYTRNAQVHATITDVQLNIDPTDEDSWTFGTSQTNATTYYSIFTEDGTLSRPTGGGISRALTGNLTSLMFEDNGRLLLNKNAQAASANVVKIQDNADSILSGDDGMITSGRQSISAASQPVTITELAPNSGIFGTYDQSDISVIKVTSDAQRGKSASIDYNDVPKSIIVGFGFASIDIVNPSIEWNSGEETIVRLTDSDANKNSRVDEDLDLNDPNVELIPSLKIGDPFTLAEAGFEIPNTIGANTYNNFDYNPTSKILTFSETPGTSDHTVTKVEKFSSRALIVGKPTQTGINSLVVNYNVPASELYKSIHDTRSSASNRLHGFNFFNYDIRGLSPQITQGQVDIYAVQFFPSEILPLTENPQGRYDNTIIRSTKIADNIGPQGLVNLNSTSIVPGLFGMDPTIPVGVVFTFNPINEPNVAMPIISDYFSFGYKNDGLVKTDRINNMIIRIEAEETGDNTSVFEGSLEFVMLNQLNILDAATYASLTIIADDPSFIVHQDLDDEDAPRVNYNDLGADGTITQVSDQEDAPAHSGVVSFNKPTYITGETAFVTVEDQDLNVDVDLIDIFTTVNANGDKADDTVGATGLPVLTNGNALGQMLDITFDDIRWQSTAGTSVDCDLELPFDQRGLFSTGFTLIETGPASGIFTSDFQVPSQVCRDATGDLSNPKSAKGLDMEVNYIDFRDASGQIVEVGDGAGIRAHTGSVSLDRTVYPIPFGSIDDFNVPVDNTRPSGRSIFPIHMTGIAASTIAGDTANIEFAETLGDGALTLYVQVQDADFDIAPSIQDVIAENVTGTNKGPVKITVSRGTSSMILGYAGGTVVKNGLIDAKADTHGDDVSSIRQLGPITETTPSSGIFEFELDVLYTDGPASATCPPTSVSFGYDSLLTPGMKGSIHSRFDEASPTIGSYCIMQGDVVTVEYTDPADASGSQNVVTSSAVFDLRNAALQIDKSVYMIGGDMILSLIEPDLNLDSDSAETYDLDLIEWDSNTARLTIGDQGLNLSAFDPVPLELRETGDNTGIFQIVMQVPYSLNGINLENGQTITLEYTDWGPDTANYVGQINQNATSTLFTSGAPPTSDKYCNGMTIGQLITSGQYNVIDNRAGAFGTKVKGTNGNDLIISSNIGNHVQGKNGNDCIIGGAAKDVISGGAGNDQIYGGAGNDSISGREGDDTMFGEDGDDVMSGGAGNDSISGGVGNDAVLGRENDDTLSGGIGNDSCIGGPGTDVIDVSCERATQ